MLIFGAYVAFFLFAVSLSWALLPDGSLRLVRRRIYSEVQAAKEPSLLAQLSEKLEPINRRLASGWYMDWMSKRLVAAGLQVPPLQQLLVQQAGACCGVTVYIVMMRKDPFNLGMLLVFAVIGFFIPSIRLDGQIRVRRRTFQRDMPEMVDLLTLCVAAGNDFMSALSRIVREFRPCPLREELAIVVKEIQLGQRRSEALRNFAQRVQTPEASAFARTLIQADRMGTGLAEAMSILSEDIRIQRYNWSERFAQQAPMKMLIPLIFCLGSAMAIVSGPVLIKFFRGGLMTPPGAESSTQARAR